VIRDTTIEPRSPWRNGFAERLIGSVRRECLDHTIVEAHPDIEHLRKVFSQGTLAETARSPAR
jgi:hypothetical protein